MVHISDFSKWLNRIPGVLGCFTIMKEELRKLECPSYFFYKQSCSHKALKLFSSRVVPCLTVWMGPDLPSGRKFQYLGIFNSPQGHPDECDSRPNEIHYMVQIDQISPASTHRADRIHAIRGCIPTDTATSDIIPCRGINQILHFPRINLLLK